MAFLNYMQMMQPMVLIRINGAPAPVVEQRRLNFSFRDQNRKRDEIQLELSDHDRLFSNGNVLQPDDIWEFRWGYFHDMSRVRTATLKEWEPGYSADAPTVRLRLRVSRGRISKKGKRKYGTEPHRVKRPKNWGIVDTSEIASKIARRHGLRPKVTKSNDASKDAPYIQAGNVSDYEYLNQLAFDINWEFFIEDDSLYYRPQAFEERPRRVLFYYPEGNNTHLLTFEPQVKVTSVAVKALSANTGQSLTRGQVISALKAAANNGSQAAVVYLEYIAKGGEVNLQDETLIAAVRGAFGGAPPPSHKGNIPVGNPPAGPGISSQKQLPSLVLDTFGPAVQSFLPGRGAGSGLGGASTETTGNVPSSGAGGGAFVISGLQSGAKNLDFIPETISTAETENTAGPGQASKQQRVAQAAYKRKVEKSVKARATVIGSPTFRTRVNLYIANVGPRFTGKWYVTEAQHDIDENNRYTVALQLKRGSLKDARGPKAVAPKDDTKATTNGETPKAVSKPGKFVIKGLQNGAKVLSFEGGGSPASGGESTLTPQSVPDT